MHMSAFSSSYTDCGAPRMHGYDSKTNIFVDVKCSSSMGMTPSHIIWIFLLPDIIWDFIVAKSFPAVTQPSLPICPLLVVLFVSSGAVVLTPAQGKGFLLTAQECVARDRGFGEPFSFQVDRQQNDIIRVRSTKTASSLTGSLA